MPRRCPPREVKPSRRDVLTSGTAPSWAKAILGFTFPGVFLVYLAQTAVGVGTHTDGALTVLGLALLVVFCGCYLVALAQWNGPTSIGVSRRAWGLFATMVALTVAVAPLAHEDVWVMYIYLCALAIGWFQARGLLVVAGLTLSAMFLPPAIPAWDAGVQWAPAFTIPLISLALYAFFAVMRTNAALTEARGEIARLAAEGERSRIARDLHDLLGHSLTSITVKAALARRLSDHDPAGAAAEIAEVEALARDALADVRSAVGGYREVTLAGELATGREVLRAAGVAALFPGAVDVVDPANRELFGWVLREGLTNVVRHARATRCTVEFGPSHLTVRDDGIGDRAAVGGPRRDPDVDRVGRDPEGNDPELDDPERDDPERDEPAGNGLSGLRERVETAGGTLTVGPAADGGWQLRVVRDVAGEKRTTTRVASRSGS